MPDFAGESPPGVNADSSFPNPILVNTLMVRGNALVFQPKRV